MTLKRLKKILDMHFAPPFLDKGTVATTWRSNGTILNIKIGRRDIDLNERGDVVAEGTNQAMPSDL